MRLVGISAVLLATLLVGATMTIADEPQEEASRPENASAKDDPTEKKGFWDRFKDPEDGKFDITAGGDGEGNEGLLPLLIPFNEPAIGVGLVVAAVYFHPTKDLPEGVERDETAPPTSSFAGAVYSENGTWGGGVGHNHVFKGGRMRYLGTLGYGDAKLDYYGIGNDEDLNEQPVPFTIEGFGTSHKFTYRIGPTRFFVGATYTYIATDVTFETDRDLTLDDGTADDAGVTVFVKYDTRNTVFTPERGTLANASVGIHSELLGGEFDYSKFGLSGIHYLPLAKERLILGLRLSYDHAGDESPFWALPFVRIRGIPAFRYLGNDVVTFEAEPRWKIDTRWSVLAFAGAGRAATALDELDDAERAYGYGTGFRYLLARKLGLAGGVDIAQGPEDTTFYIIFGNAWAF